ncbi:ribbon-helix-helix domain-containing protein [Cupriavidus metallidurans]|uniref:ribbon-helix-helix domain-containing protein n=1 Tax=Cupriavidus metallidurans TaxID=119219 RepID=UPI003D094FC7
MTKQKLQPLLGSAKDQSAVAAPVRTAVKLKNDAVAQKPTEATKVRQIHKEGEVNISAYFPAEVKASLRMVQAKTGNNVKDCLAEALRDLFRKHNVPVSVELGKGR